MRVIITKSSKLFFWIIILGCLLLVGRQIYATSISEDPDDLVINEFVAANVTGLTDEDGDYSDWLELYNPEIYSLDLSGYGLSDNPVEPFKWTFPDINIGSKGILLLFASGKNRSGRIIHRETIIDWGDEWRYFIGSEQPPQNWSEIDLLIQLGL